MHETLKQWDILQDFLLYGPKIVTDSRGPATENSVNHKISGQNKNKSVFKLQAKVTRKQNSTTLKF